MAVKELTFTLQDDGKYSAGFISGGVRTVVQLQRERPGSIIVHARIPGMEEYAPSTTFYDKTSSFIFEVNLPGNIEILLESYTEVISAKVLEEE